MSFNLFFKKSVHSYKFSFSHLTFILLALFIFNSCEEDEPENAVETLRAKKGFLLENIKSYNTRIGPKLSQNIYRLFSGDYATITKPKKKRKTRAASRKAGKDDALKSESAASGSRAQSSIEMTV